MKITLALVSLFAGASAFAPSSSVARQSTQLAAGKDEGEKSKAIPFVARPKLLDGTLAGDVGFEYVYTCESHFLNAGGAKSDVQLMHFLLLFFISPPLYILQPI